MRASIDNEPDGADHPRPPRGDMMDAVDQFSRRLSGALVIAGGLIGLGIYSASGSDDALKYQAFAADGEVFRVNTQSGTIIACNATRCMTVLERGQDLAESQSSTLFKAPSGPAQPAPQLPAPAPQQTTPPAPAVAQPVLAPPASPK